MTETAPKPRNADIAHKHETETVTLKRAHVHSRIAGQPGDRFLMTQAQAKRLKAAKIAE